MQQVVSCMTMLTPHCKSFTNSVISKQNLTTCKHITDVSYKEKYHTIKHLKLTCPLHSFIFGSVFSNRVPVNPWFLWITFRLDNVQGFSCEVSTKMHLLDEMCCKVGENLPLKTPTLFSFTILRLLK